MNKNITLKWFGHSYVEINCDKKIIIDPHDGGSLNLPEYRTDADILLVTHNHFDHNAIEMVNYKYLIKYKDINKTIYNIKIIGNKLPHDKLNGKLRGLTTAYKIICNGLNIVHLGDLGTINVDLTSILGETDILFIPVGGVYTIDAYEAWSLIENYKPKIVIPIHYWVPYSTLPLDPLDKFLDISKARKLRVEKNTVDIPTDSLPSKTTIIVFPFPRVSQN